MTTDQTKPNILFVDDEQHILSSLKRLFIDEPYSVFTADSGAEALEVVKTVRFAVIVSDQRMPRMSGFEFLEKAKQIQPDTVRMVLTGYADINAAINAINIGGASRYLTKPWDDNEIILIVRDAAEKYNLIIENKRLTDLTLQQNEELKKWNTELEHYVQQQTIDLSNRNKDLDELNKKMQQNLDQIIVSFSALMELRDKSMRDHSSNVALISSDIAGRLGLNSDEIKKITIAAQLHDIGKIGMPDLVMIKNPAKFTQDELYEYKKHPVRGQAALDTIDLFRKPAVFIRHHHENFDGSGFPDGLKSDQIPIGARIIKIADTLDRLINNYEISISVEDALAKIKTELNTKHDPKLYSYIAETAHEHLSSFAAPKDNIEVELKPKDLAPGMTVSRDIRTGTGLLLLRKFTVLNNQNIETLKRSYHIDPAAGGIFVWVKKR
ncbi:MAG: response regulator [Dissulfurispiraceae bacterium]|jgi:response regulator RpfG family c-di-GMP phosphodiesterase|nr:response regulator [Dissulfurispiraceae bacterium]